MGGGLLRRDADDAALEALGHVANDGEQAGVRAVETQAGHQGGERQACLRWIVRGFALPGIGLALQRQERGQNLVATLGVLDIDVRPGADRLLPVPHRLDAGLADSR